jgi:2-(1,2-epoxy-1,2-dihydrophenyl)acetyl-CoA isomerase
MADRVLVDCADGIGTLTLNRPEKLNALDRPLCEALIAGLQRLSADDSVRVIIVTGAGRGFCAGADLSVLGVDGDALVAAGKEIALLIRSAPKPVLAAVNGVAAGGGANLALACDYRIAADSAKIGQVFHKLGLGPDWGGTYFLPRLTGMSRALELVWSARMVPAPEALTLGLFDQVVPADGLTDAARSLAGSWAAQPALAVRRAKEALYASEAGTLRATLDLEITHQHELFATPDARARIAESLSARSR